MARSCRGLAVAQPYDEERLAPEHHRVEGSTRRTRMSISYTNRKGVTYTLYRGQTKTGKPRYYFGRADRVAVKHDRIEIYEQVGADYDALFSDLQMAGLSSPDLAERLQAQEERYARYTPVLRFILLDPRQWRFGAQRMCYRGRIDGWLELAQTGPVAKLAHALIPTLDTDQFYELW